MAEALQASKESVALRMRKAKEIQNSPLKSIIQSQQDQYEEEDDQQLYQANPFPGLGVEGSFSVGVSIDQQPQRENKNQNYGQQNSIQQQAS